MFVLMSLFRILFKIRRRNKLIASLFIYPTVYAVTLISLIGFRIFWFRWFKWLDVITSRRIEPVNSGPEVNQVISFLANENVTVLRFFSPTYANNCLYQCISLYLLLFLAGIDSEFIIGIWHFPFHSHAYIQRGPKVITGEEHVARCLRTIFKMSSRRS